MGVGVGRNLNRVSMILVLRNSGRCRRGKEDCCKISHHASPSSGRTVTTRNMPACMC